MACPERRAVGGCFGSGRPPCSQLTIALGSAAGGRAERARSRAPCTEYMRRRVPVSDIITQRCGNLHLQADKWWVKLCTLFLQLAFISIPSPGMVRRELAAHLRVNRKGLMVPVGCYSLIVYLQTYINAPDPHRPVNPHTARWSPPRRAYNSRCWTVGLFFYYTGFLPVYQLTVITWELNLW